MLNIVLLFIVVAVLHLNRVKLIIFPVLLGSFGSLDVIVGLFLQVVELQVAVGHDVEFPQLALLGSLACLFLFTKSDQSQTYFGRVRARSLVRLSKVMVSQGFVRNQVVVSANILAWSEVPRLLFRVVISVFKTFKLVLEVQNVVRLLISELSVLLTQSVSISNLPYSWQEHQSC